MFETFFGTCEKLASSALPKGRFASALNYALNRRNGMMNLFLDGRLTLDNNYALSPTFYYPQHLHTYPVFA